MEISQFSPEWWTDRDRSMRWCHDFCTPFFEKDPSLLDDPVTHSSVGVVLFNTPDGATIPVGYTALKDNAFVFEYHPSYLADPQLPPLSVTLPKRAGRFESQGRLLPYFDNLLAEGWFGKSQGKALGVDPERIDGETEPLASRYNRLMMFGRDCPGASWATYIKIDPAIAEEQHQEMVAEALRSRATISGVQPKLLGVMEHGKLRPARYWETSTHIIKLPSAQLPKLIEYEHMAAVATKALLPLEHIVDTALETLHLRNGATRDVLAIKRFDRTPQGGKIHFEELNQLLNKPTTARYDGCYSDIADFVREKMGKEGVKKFYSRLVSQFLMGNVDNHFKNFAMFPPQNGEPWKITDDYDLAPSANYDVHSRKSDYVKGPKPERGQLALRIKGTQIHTSYREPNPKVMLLGDSTVVYEGLDSKALVMLGKQFQLELSEIREILQGIVAHIPDAIHAVRHDPSPLLDVPAGKAAGRKSSSHATSCREDFCRRIEGRQQQLFGSLERYLGILERKGMALHL